MDWGKVTITSFCFCLGLACGPGDPQAVETDTDTDTDTEDGTGTTSDATATNPTATNPTATNATSNSDTGTTTTTSATTNATSDTGPADTGTGDTTDPTETGECPFGEEGCLCDVGAVCDDGLFCNKEGICEAPPDCRPIDTDPHGDEGSALGLDALGCNEGMDLGTIGTIEGPEVDWYTFDGNDAGFCGEQPGAGIMSSEPLEVCIFIECDNGGDVQQLNCGGGSMDATSPDGREGCCGADGAFVEDYDCSGFGGKDVTAFISIGSDQEICADYDLSYQF